MAERTPYSQKLSNLRRRMIDAVALGVIDRKNKDIYEGTLLQIMNEAEKQRGRCMELKANYERQMAQAEAQAHAYTQVVSIVYAVLNGFVAAAERSVQEDQEVHVKEEAAKIPDAEVAEEVAAAVEGLKDSSGLDDEEKKALTKLATEQAKKKKAKRKTTPRKRAR